MISPSPPQPPAQSPVHTSVKFPVLELMLMEDLLPPAPCTLANLCKGHCTSLLPQEPSNGFLGDKLGGLGTQHWWY